MSRQKDNKSFRDIKAIVLERIQSGTWAPDAILPSESALVTEFDSTRTTVNRALRELAEEGYLERKRKAGTRVLRAPVRHARFAIPLTRVEIEGTGARYRYALIGAEMRDMPDWLRARLDLRGAIRAAHVRALHYADGKPFQYEDRWIVEASVPEVAEADFSDTGPNEWLIERIPVSNVELSFMATRADQTVAALMDAPMGEPIFTAERLTWLRGQPVTFARLHFAPGYRMTTRI